MASDHQSEKKWRQSSQSTLGILDLDLKYLGDYPRHTPPAHTAQKKESSFFTGCTHVSTLEDVGAILGKRMTSPCLISAFPWCTENILFCTLCWEARQPRDDQRLVTKPTESTRCDLHYLSPQHLGSKGKRIKSSHRS